MMSALDEYLKEVRRSIKDEWADQYLLDSIPRLLAIIEAQRAEIKKAERVVGTLVAHDSFAIVEAAGQAVAKERFGGNAAIEARFEKGEL